VEAISVASVSISTILDRYYEENSLLSKCVAILAACSSGFLFTELHLPTKIITYPTPKFQV
jgi:hypothetical protein